MATIRIHEDQENSVPNNPLRQKQSIMAQPKRSVLGVLDNRILPNTNGNAGKGKEPFGLTKSCANIVNPNKENISHKEKRKNIVNPIVPVAQFEAFKVYEDEEIAERYRKSNKSNMCKIEEGRLRIKSDTTENEPKTKQIEGAESPKRCPAVQPMSTDKNVDDSMQLAEEAILKNSKNLKDRFFEMEEYRERIYIYLREHELSHRAKPGYMRKQPDITSNMRSILVDWLVEVAEEYKLQTETLYLAVNYIDRFLSYMSVVRAKLQLVGTAAMFLASKYEEIYPPEIGEFVYITDDTYNKRQVVRMEHLILKVLSFDLSVPTPLAFITAMSISNKITEKTMYLSMYFCELSMLQGEVYLEFLPSALAASGIALARHTLGEQAWPKSFAESTGYDLKHLKVCIEFLQGMFKEAPQMAQHAIQDKYKAQKYMHVALLTPNESAIDFN